MGALQQRFGPSAERRVALGDMGNAALAPWISSLRRYRLPRLLMPRSFGLPPELTWDQTQPRPPGRDRARKSSPLPIAAINAEAIVRADARDGTPIDERPHSLSSSG